MNYPKWLSTYQNTYPHIIININLCRVYFTILLVNIIYTIGSNSHMWIEGNIGSKHTHWCSFVCLYATFKGILYNKHTQAFLYEYVL